MPCEASSSPIFPTARSPAGIPCRSEAGGSSSSIPGPATRPETSWSGSPGSGYLFAGDLLIEDGVTMLVDGSSGRAAPGPRSIDSLHPRTVVPGHGAIPAAGGAGSRDPRLHYRASSRACGRPWSMGSPMGRALATPSSGRSDPPCLTQLPAAAQRAFECILEEETGLHGTGFRAMTRAMALSAGLGADLQLRLRATRRRARAPSWSPPSSWPRGERRGRMSIVDVRADVFIYLKDHLPGRGVPQSPRPCGPVTGGMPVQLLTRASLQRALFPPGSELRSAGRDL